MSVIRRRFPSVAVPSRMLSSGLKSVQARLDLQISNFLKMLDGSWYIVSLEAPKAKSNIYYCKDRNVAFYCGKENIRNVALSDHVYYAAFKEFVI